MRDRYPFGYVPVRRKPPWLTVLSRVGGVLLTITALALLLIPAWGPTWWVVGVLIAACLAGSVLLALLVGAAIAHRDPPTHTTTEEDGDER